MANDAKRLLRLLCAPAMLAVALRADPQQGTAGQPTPSSLKALSLEQLSQIEVTSPSKQPTPAFRSPVAIYVITGEDIRRSGVTTIPDALRLAPGVEVARIDGSKWSVGIRGFGTRNSRDVLVLIDGRSVYTPLFAGTYWEVQDTLLEDIDRIEVIRGPGGTIWGPNAVNGVINIITRSSRETEGTYVRIGGGNEEQGHVGFRYGGSAANGLSYRVYAKGYTRGPEIHSDHDNFDDWRGVQSGFRMDWDRGGADTFTFQGDLYQQEDGERVALSSYVPAFTGVVDGTASLSGGNLLARWTHKLKNGTDLQVQTYYDRTNRYEPNLGENRDTFDIDLVARTRAGTRHQLTYGAGARLSDGRFLEVASGLVFDPANRLDYLLTGFFQDEITLIDRKLSLTAGSKVLRTNYTGLEFEPSVRLLWMPTEKHAFWASFTHAVRTPSRAERDFYLSSYLGLAGGVQLFARFNPNPDFAPEQLNGYELGYRALIAGNFFIDFAGFWNHYHDLFSQDIAGPIHEETGLPFPQPVQPGSYLLLPAEFGNDLFGSSNGGEIAPEWRPANFWRMRATYSYLNMSLDTRVPPTLGSTPASIERSSPRHQATMQSSFDLTRALQADLIYRYVSALPAQSAPAYSTGDARLAWRFLPGFEFAVVGRNLFRPGQVEYAADPGGPVAIRRSVYGSLTWRK